MAVSAASRVFATGDLAARRRQALAALYLGLAVIVLYPVLVTQVPGLVDYPNHIARVHILGNLDSDPALAANYRANWGVMPNLAMDALLFPFADRVPVELLGRIFVGTTMLMLLGGTMALSSALHGRLSCWPALAGLLVYNHVLAWGFVNYLFGIGLYLFVFAAWVASANRPAWHRLLFFSAMAVLLFFTHLFALAVYGVSVLAWQAGSLWRAAPETRRSMMGEQVYAAAQFVPAAFILLASMPEADRHGVLFVGLMEKLRALLSPVMLYADAIDFVAFMFFVLAVLAVGRLRIHPSLRFPILALAIIAVAMPYRIIGAWGAVSYADLRLPVVIAILLVAALPPDSVNRRTSALIVGMAMAILLWRAAETATRWDTVSRQVAEYRQALTVIERGAAILPAQWSEHGRSGGDFRFAPTYWHLAAFAVIDRAAFVPPLFTDPRKQPVASTPERAAIDSTAGLPADRQQLLAGADRYHAATADRDLPQGSARYWLNWPNRFDYVAAVRFRDGTNPFPDLLRLVRRGSFFDIYRVVPATCVTLDVKPIPGTCWTETGDLDG